MAMNPRLLRPMATAGFDPRTIAALFAWYDAADAASVTLNGANISQINDKSGNGRHLTQATALNQPPYLANGINGRRVIAPDGEDDRLLLAADIAGFKPRYVVGAFMPISNNAGAFVKLGDNGNNGLAIGQGGGGLDGIGNNAIALHEAIAFRATSINMTSNQAVVFSYQYETQVHRVSPYATVDLANANLNDGTNIQLGGYGVAPGVTRYTDAYIGEVLVYTTVPGSADILLIERYLGRKWGVTII